MTIQEILEAHKGMRWSDPTIGADRLCLCGHFIGAPESRTNGADHRAHVAEVLDKHMQETLRGVWERAYSAGWNDEEWRDNPYTGKETPNGR